MHLESNTQIGSKIKQSSLVVNVQLEYQPQSPAAERDHAGRLEVGLRNVGLKVLLVVNQLRPAVVQQARTVLEVPLGLDQLAVNQVADDGREYLAHVGTVKLVGQHSAGSGDHEVAGEHGSAGSVHLVGGLDAAPALGLVDDVVLEERGVVSNLNASSQGHDLLVLLCLLKISSFPHLSVHSPGKSKQNS